MVVLKQPQKDGLPAVVSILLTHPETAKNPQYDRATSIDDLFSRQAFWHGPQSRTEIVSPRPGVRNSILTVFHSGLVGWAITCSRIRPKEKR
jgi:hypothetical protein